MPPPRGPPMIPSEHMSVGGYLRQHYESHSMLVTAENTRSWTTYLEKGFSYAAGQQFDIPTAGSSRAAQNIPPQMRDARWDKYLLSNPRRCLENGENGDAELKSQARKRRGEPARQSKMAEREAAVPGGAGSNHGPRGKVRYNDFGLLEFWKADEEAWIPAVYHCRIRAKLINMAKTCEADVYRHPRACGEHDLDITAFLDSQKDWDLERDNGWTNIPDGVLYMFSMTGYKNPTYDVLWMYDEGSVVLDLDNHPVKNYSNIPLTISSKIEGALMEAIRRLDRRITMQDFEARLPKECGNGEVLTPGALNMRVSRFRLENCVPALKERKGTKNLRQYIWNLMSPAARDANSTRELSKLTKDQQEEARKQNAGKHDANAGGWARTKESQSNSSKEVSAPVNAQEKGTTKSASLRSSQNKPPCLTCRISYDSNTERQPPSFASEQGRKSHPSKRRKVREATQSAIHAPQGSYPRVPYGDASFNPFLRSANHGYGPINSILPSEVAFTTSSDNSLPFPTLNPSAGFGCATTPSPALPRAFHNGQHLVPSAQHDCTHQRSDVENTLENPYCNFDLRTWSIDDPAEFVSSTSQRIVDTLANETDPNSSMEIDYRSLPPRNEEEMEDIQRALALTRANYHFHTNCDSLETTRSLSYFQQVGQLMDSLAEYWTLLDNPPRMPDLMTYQEPWRNGFKSWAVSAGGGEALVNEIFDQYGGVLVTEDDDSIPR